MIDKLLGRRYKVIRFLGGGGGGETYIAVDTQRPGQPECVVKRLKPASSDPAFLPIARRLFHREAETLERLGKHDQIPRLLAYFEEEEEFYLVQDFIGGPPLNIELPAGCVWSETKVIHMLRDVLSILEFVHRDGVIHRDIKPANLIRRLEDSKIVLIDFGAVKEIRLNPQVQTQSHINPTTISIGTQGYMPSEQVRGKPRPSSDIYALGMIGIQALTGIDPVNLEEDQDGEAIWQQYAKVSDELAMILNGMVRYHFRDRYQTATDVLKALEHLTNRNELQNDHLQNKESNPEWVGRSIEASPTEEIAETSSQTSTIDALQQTPIHLGTNSSQQRVTQVSEDAQLHSEVVLEQQRETEVSSDAVYTVDANHQQNPSNIIESINPELTVQDVSPPTLSPRRTEVSSDELLVTISEDPQETEANLNSQTLEPSLSKTIRRETTVDSALKLPLETEATSSLNPRKTEVSSDPVDSRERTPSSATGSHSRKTQISSDSFGSSPFKSPVQEKTNKRNQFLWLGLGGSAIVGIAAVITWFVVNSSDTLPRSAENDSPPSASTNLPNESPQRSADSSPSATTSPVAETSKPKGNYSQLRQYLQSSPPNWEAADRETFRVLLEVAGSESKKQGRFNLNEWRSIDCEEFKEIDRLWRNASGGKLGFSSQVQIYNEDKSYSSFRKQVGWLDGTQAKVDWEYKSAQSSVSYITGQHPNFNDPRRGHLPAQLEWEPINDRPHTDIRFIRLNECKL